MPLAKCKRCEKMFNKVDSPVCNGCQDAEKEDSDKVRDCITEHPGISLGKIVEMTGVNLKVVKRMLDDGIVKEAKAVPNAVRCVQCGAPAVNFERKLCKGCVERLNNQMASMQRDIKFQSDQPAATAEENKSVMETFSDKQR